MLPNSITSSGSESSDEEPMQTFQITIPADVDESETIEFQLPDGRTVRIFRFFGEDLLSSDRS